MIEVAVAAWMLCFGKTPISCEANGQVYTCDKYGCVEYPETPQPFIITGDSGITQWIPDGSGVLAPMCVTIAQGGYSEIATCTENSAIAIPQDDFKPVEKPHD